MVTVKQRERVGRKPHSKSRKISSGLPRPNNPISYDLPKTISSTTRTTHQPERSKALHSHQGSSASSYETAAETLVNIARVTLLLNLVHRRNKNQHRNQLFFKWINLLRRAVKLLQQLVQQYLRTEDGSSNGTQTSNGNAKQSTIRPSAQDTRKRFEKQAEIRSQRELHEEWIRETLIPGAYLAFSSLVSDEQFASLGVMLIGTLSDITHITGTPRRVDKLSTKHPHLASSAPRNSRLTATSTIMTGPELGEVMERTYDSADAREIMHETRDWGTPIDRVSTEQRQNAGSVKKEPSANAHLSESKSSKIALERSDITKSITKSIKESKQQFTHPEKVEPERAMNSSEQVPNRTAERSKGKEPGNPSLALNLQQDQSTKLHLTDAKELATSSQRKNKRRKKGGAFMDDLFSAFD